MEIENEWIQLQEEKDKLMTEIDDDPVIAKIDGEMETLRGRREVIVAAHELRMIPVITRLHTIEQEFLSMYDGQKTLPLDVLTLTFRDTKSLKVLDKGAIVDTLMKIKQVEKGVKNFALKHLRALAEAEVLPEESYEWDTKRNVSVKEREE